MKQAKFVAYEQNVIVYKFMTQKVCFDTMALLAWWSAPEAKLTTKFNKKYIQSPFVHMLQTLPVSSNSEVIVMFPGKFDIDPLVRDKSMFSWQKKLLRLIWQICAHPHKSEYTRAQSRTHPLILGHTRTHPRTPTHSLRFIGSL